MSDLHCTFCCKNEKEVRALIAAKDVPVYICDECVEFATYIILRQRHKDSVVEQQESKG